MKVLSKNQHTPPQSANLRFGGVCCSHMVLDSGYKPHDHRRARICDSVGYVTLATNRAMRRRSRFAVLCAIALFLFSSCTEKTNEAPLSDLQQAFADAGLRLLRESVSSRDFSLPLVSTAVPAASQPEMLQTLSDLKGKVVFLNFWATWCIPCRDEMPSMEALHNRFKDDGLEIVAVNSREGREGVLDFLADYGLTFPVVLDEDGRVSAAYGIQAIPTTFLIDRDGRIILRLIGSINWDTEKIHAAIESLLNSV